MRVLLGGVRGSTPVSGPEFLTFGGNTTCMLVEADSGAKVLVDVGSGLRVVSDYLATLGPLRQLQIVMTHYHLDHLIGFPSFAALYDRDCILDLAAPDLLGVSVREALSRVMDNPFWPVQLEATAARLSFTSLGEKPTDHNFGLDGLRFAWCPVHHPGGCTAYRFDETATGRSLVVATDLEWRQSTPDEKASLLALCRHPAPPDLLIVDGQFTDENYGAHVGWGHSSWQDALDIARGVDARRVLVTHHCPEKNDAELAEIDRELRTRHPAAALAREGMHLDV